MVHVNTINHRKERYMMAAIDLTKYGITGATEIVHNPSYEFLFEEKVNRVWKDLT